jgi:hypothetical protein
MVNRFCDIYGLSMPLNNVSGFWQSRWNDQHSRADREHLINILVTLMSEGKVHAYTLHI